MPSRAEARLRTFTLTGVPPTRQGIARRRGTFAATDTVAILGPDEGLLAMASATCDAGKLEEMPQRAAVVRLRRVLR